MKSFILWISVIALVTTGRASVAADSSGAGIIKGMVTNGGKPASGAVVSIEGLSPHDVRTQMPPHKPSKKIIDQRSLRFIPTVVAIMAGDTVDFPNNDKSWHNVYSKGGANDFDLGVYPPGKTRSKKFDKPGVFRILCNAHPDMEAYVVVKEHPFFSVSDSRGNYRIEHVPLGKVLVRTWHPNSDIRSETVEIVREGEVFALNVELKKR
jgi:plastocyanin